MFSSSSNAITHPVVVDCGLCGMGASLCDKNQNAPACSVVVVILLHVQ